MKKSFKTIGAALLTMGAMIAVTACGQVQSEPVSHQENHKGHKHDRRRPAMSRNDENILWVKFDSLTDEQKKMIINQKLERIEMRDSISLSRINEFQAQMKNFDNMSFDEQKALLETREKPQAPLTEEQLAERKKKAEEHRKQHQGERKHANGGHEGHNHQHVELKPVNLNLPNN